MRLGKVAFCIGWILLAASAAFAGRYQFTRDGKALVWNEHPERGETVSWSGGRDKQGYATGAGTLTWYAPQKGLVTGSNIVSTRHYVPVSTASGTMVHGRLEQTGAAAATPSPPPKVAKTTPAPEASATATEREVAKTESTPRISPTPAYKITPPTPAPVTLATPTPAAPEVVLSTPAPSAAAPSPTGTPTSDSAASLANPPSSLRLDSSAPEPEKSAAIRTPTQPVQAADTPASPRLTTNEVIELANTEAKSQGYDLNHYQRSQTSYNAEEDSWTVIYNEKAAAEPGKRLSVKVEDKAKKASVEPGK